MSGTVIVRRASIEDAEDLADLAVRSFRDTFEADNDPSNIDDYLRRSLTTDSMRADFGDPCNIYLIAGAADNRSPLGYAKLCTDTQHPSVRDQHTIELERLYADKPAIGSGVGAALMRTCLADAETLQCESIWLGVWEHNERAIRFYDRWGFEVVGARQFTLGADQQNDLIMVRTLNND